MTEFIPAIGPIAAAIIAGAVAFLASVLTKEHKTSEFRQAWIDALREDVAELSATSRFVCDFVASLIERGKSHTEYFAEIAVLQDKIVRIEITCDRICLRLNPDEHRELLDATEEMRKLDPLTKQGDSRGSDLKAKNLVAACQKVLKKEWRRVKRGETIFMVTKWVSLCVAAAAIFVGILLARGIFIIQYAQ